MQRRVTREAIGAPTLGAGRIASLVAIAGLMASCARGGTTGDELDRTSSAMVSTASLELKVLTNTCVANQVFDTFQIKNTGSAPVKFSDLKVKLWANDTTAQSLVSHVWTAGCATGANGSPSCVHQVTGVTGTTTSFGPACGPDVNHQANWEITLSSTDTNTLAAGATWNGLQTGYNLASYANFSPGVATWYSGCVGSTAVADPHFAIYYKGNLVYSNGLTAPDCRAPKGTHPLTGFRTPAIAAAPFVRPVPESQVITFSLSLPVRQPAGQPTLADLAGQVSDPANPLYRQYLTQDQFTNLYAPTATDYQAIVAWAQSAGLTVKTFPSRMVVGVSGPASVLKKALYMNLNFYQRPGGSVFYAPDREPSIDLNAPLVEIGALDNYLDRQPAATVVTDWGSNRLLTNGYGLGDGAFGYGEGECVGLFADDGYSLADLNGLMSVKDVYTKNPGLVKPTFRTILLSSKLTAGQPAPLGCRDGTLCGPKPNCPMGSPNCCMMPDPAMPGSFKLESVCDAVCANDAGTATTGSACPSGPTTPAAEIAADIDMAMVLASGLKEVVVYEGGSTDTTLAAMASDPAKCKQLSTSWVFGIEPRTVELFQQLTVQGQAFSTASGDDGAVGDQGNIERLPYVTVVGGTVLTGTAQDATPNVFEYTSEAPWGNSGSFIADGTSGLPAVPIPGYQQGVNMTFCPSGAYCNGSVQYRNVPDIAMVASQVQISFRGARPDVNGTSLSSPLWAGWLAVANAHAKKNNVPSIGFPNPAIYAIGKTRGTASDIYKDTFHDLVGGAVSTFNPPCRPGHDCGPPSVGGPAWPAVAGYDLASGWGSPTPKLIQALTTGLPPLSPILDIASGWAHTCALKSDKTVACWGENLYGQLGTGSVATNSPTPLAVPGVSGIASVSAGFTFSCALEPLPSGKVYCWGSNDCAILGTGDTTNTYRMAPAQVMGLPLPAVAVTGGVSHACALLTDNSVYCWGCNFAGQLGNNGPPGQDATTPIKVASLSNVSAITAGQFHTCAVASGAPWCWGSNSEGQLGDGTTTVQRVPVRAAPTLTFDASNFVSYLSSGSGVGDHTCMVVHHAAAHDDLWCWGSDNLSQLGDNGLLASQGKDHTPTELLVQPVDTNPLTVWSSSFPGGALASGNGLTCVIRSADHDATECWGHINAAAGPELTLMTRTEVASLAGVKVSKVVAGFGHACVLLASGDVRCWGQNGEGQVGDGVGVPFWPEPNKVAF